MSFRIKFIRDETADGVEVIIKAREQDETVKEILRKLGGEENLLPFEALSKNGIIFKEDIIIISKVGRVLSVRTTGGEYFLRDPLYKIEEELDSGLFVKISQSEIVDLMHVKKWHFEGGGVMRIEMDNGIESYTSRRYAVQIRGILTGKGGKK